MQQVSNFFEQLGHDGYCRESFDIVVQPLREYTDLVESKLDQFVELLNPWQLESAALSLKKYKISWIRIGCALLCSLFVLPLFWAIRAMHNNRLVDMYRDKLLQLAWNVSLTTAHLSLQKMMLQQATLSMSLDKAQKHWGSVERRELIVAFKALEKIHNQAKAKVAFLAQGSFKQEGKQLELSNQLSTEIPRLNVIYAVVKHQLAQPLQESLLSIDVESTQLSTVVATTESASKSSPIMASPLQDFFASSPKVKKKEMIKGHAVELISGVPHVEGSDYLSSSLQTIRWTPALRELVERELPTVEYISSTKINTLKEKDYLARAGLQLKMRKIFQDLDEGRGANSTQVKALKDQMQRMRAYFVTGNSADSAECLRWLLDRLLISTKVLATGEVVSSGLLLDQQVEFLVVNGQDDLTPGHDLKFPLTIRTVQEQHGILPLEMVAAEKTSSLGDKRGYIANHLDSGPTAVLTKNSLLHTLGSHYTLSSSDADPTAQILKDHAKTLMDSNPLHQQALIIEKGEKKYCVGQMSERRTISNSPPVLMLSLQRFRFTSSLHKEYIAGSVDIPLQLDISPFLTLQRTYLKPKYELSSIIAYNSFHYVTYQKHASDWYLYKGTNVKKIVSFDPSNIDGAYILIYSHLPEISE